MKILVLVFVDLAKDTKDQIMVVDGEDKTTRLDRSWNCVGTSNAASDAPALPSKPMDD